MPGIIATYAKMVERDPVLAESVRVEFLRLLDQEHVERFLRDCAKEFRRRKEPR
jgi:hypothetical protein